MIEIIPNWHPIFVHFTVGLLTTAFGCSVLSYLLNHLKIMRETVVTELEIAGRWCLWAAAVVTIATIAAGLYAYNTVHHDETGHLAMITHRSWALSTATLLSAITLWSLWRYYKHEKLTITFLVALFVVQLFLLSTAWHGAELVYRHGLGVIYLPNYDKEAHHHHDEM